MGHEEYTDHEDFIYTIEIKTIYGKKQLKKYRKWTRKKVEHIQ